MHTSKTAIWLTAFVSLVAAVVVGCSDVGDTSPGNGPMDSGTSADTTTPIPGSDDATADDSSTEEPDTGTGSTPEAAASDDASTPGEPEDTGTGTPEVDAATPEDTGTPVQDEGAPEASPSNDSGGSGGIDSGEHDAMVEEASAPEAGVDAGVEHDAGGGVPEAGPVDAGEHDAGGPDATTVEDAGVADTGAPDTGTVGGHDSGAPVPCTSASQVSQKNCVECPDSPTSDGVCTPTEALIVMKDIANNNLDATGQLKTFSQGSGGKADVQGSCYSCLNSNACLDDNQQDVGNECADSPDLSGSATGSGNTECLAALSCIVQTDCEGAGGLTGSETSSSDSIQLCYCGGNNAGSACQTSGAATNGLCVTQEAAGFGFAYTDNKDILANYTSQTYPTGIANALFSCAAANKCTICE